MDLPNKTNLIAILSSSVLTGLFTATLGYYLSNLSYKKNKLHDNKILEIKNFYKSYQLFRLGVGDYHHYTMFADKKIETTLSMSNALVPLLRDFQYESMIIKLFLNENEYQKVIEIEEILFQIKKEIDIFHLNFNNKNPYVANSGNRMLEVMELDLEKKLPDLMKDIELGLRKAFK